MPSTPRLAPQRPAEIAGSVEQDILAGRLAPGVWLKQIDLEARYGASRIAVRQALDKLVDKQLVRLVAHRGYCVAEVSREKFIEVMRVRAILEEAAALECVGRTDAALLARLADLAQAFIDAVGSGTVEQQEAANRAFHAAMLQACPNRELVSLAFEMRNRVPLAMTRAKNTRPLMESTARDHVEMVDCLRTGNRERLATVMRRHVLGYIPDA